MLVWRAGRCRIGSQPGLYFRNSPPAPAGHHLGVKMVVWRAEVPLFVAPANRKHVQQHLSTTCGATVAFVTMEATMQVKIRRCAGLDIHQATVVACAIIQGRNKQPRKEICTFGTMTCDLEALRDWLKQEGVTHVGMESTGVYWMPVYEVLEDLVTRIVGNARHMRNVPGRKTDVKDAEWIATLVSFGLIQPSFVPCTGLRVLRELLRYRRKLVEEESA
jgi:hypothetical protein